MKRVLGKWLRGLAGWIDPPKQFNVGTVFVKPDFASLGNAQEILDGINNGSIDYKSLRVTTYGGGGSLGVTTYGGGGGCDDTSTSGQSVNFEEK